MSEINRHDRGPTHWLLALGLLLALGAPVRAGGDAGTWGQSWAHTLWDKAYGYEFDLEMDLPAFPNFHRCNFELPGGNGFGMAYAVMDYARSYLRTVTDPVFGARLRDNRWAKLPLEQQYSLAEDHQAMEHWESQARDGEAETLSLIRSLATAQQNDLVFTITNEEGTKRHYIFLFRGKSEQLFVQFPDAQPGSRLKPIWATSFFFYDPHVVFQPTPPADDDKKASNERRKKHRIGVLLVVRRQDASGNPEFHYLTDADWNDMATNFASFHTEADQKFLVASAQSPIPADHFLKYTGTPKMLGRLPAAMFHPIPARCIGTATIAKEQPSGYNWKQGGTTDELAERRERARRTSQDVSLSEDARMFAGSLSRVAVDSDAQACGPEMGVTYGAFDKLHSGLAEQATGR